MARVELWHLSFLLFPALVLVHLFVAPYTKVEESFNIQATHDVLTYGVPTHDVYNRLKASYDHMTFAGAVPRTFVGALVLATVAKPVVLYGHLNGEQQQLLVRAVLGLFNAVALLVYASGVRRAYGKTTAVWYTVLQASQFHLWYYASRTLPNMFAFGISTLALYCFLPVPTTTTASRITRTRLGVYLLTLTSIIFRSELALLLASHCLYLLLRSSGLKSAISLVRTVFLPAAISATVAGLLCTVPTDTFFWQSPTWLWPELAAFWSNVFPAEGSLGASAWGTSPWHWYFTSAIPRLFLNPLLLLFISWGLIMTPHSSEIFALLTPSLTYVGLYSILAHKETRFLFPIIPPITAAIARCADYISTRSSRSFFAELATNILILTTVITALGSHVLLLPLSAQTYVGAHALKSLHDVSLNYGPQPSIHVHLTNLALQTGVTHFLDAPSSPLHSRRPLIMPGSADGTRPSITSTRPPTRWVYDKSDNATALLTPEFWAQFDYVVVEDPARVIGLWDVVDRVPGLGRPRALSPDVGRGLLVLGPESQRREDDALVRLVDALYGEPGQWVYGVIHDVLREGYGLDTLLGKEVIPTKGWWVHWGLETKLYILKRAEAVVAS